ncbi:MAG: gamma-glutamyl-gamma-aminobutyrate hydrolase family protein [Candidatus Hydrogenedentes bacterium]|nr:gamma-glutamyl-gamma-aminobutyrate hydrolase family protein [Candidatus Hydrogenedentota bacterium]
MKPLIGITSEFVPGTLFGRPWNSNILLTSYTKGVSDAGGAAVILPLALPETAESTLRRLDGLILSGGNNDIPASVLGEEQHPASEPLPMERWESECLWLQTALNLDKPVLGICLGMQAMNVYAGGSMIQDIPDQCPGSGVHGDETRMYRHDVELVEGTHLRALAPGPLVSITSSHHQAIRSAPQGYRLAAISPDGIIEAIEDPLRDFVIGVQWHPERTQDGSSWLLEGFVRHCAARVAGVASR